MNDNDIAVTFHGKYHWGADQEFWRCPDLSCSAKVVWILLRSAASMPNGVKISRLSRWAARYPGGIGKDIQELIATGYVRRTMSRRHGAVIEKVTYDLYDFPQTVENQQSPRKSKHGFRPTDSVERMRVSSRVVKSKVVKSSSPPDPRDPEEEEGVKKEKNPTALPIPFSAADKASQKRLTKACNAKGINPVELCQATAWEYVQAGQAMREPIGAAIGKLTAGEAHETIAAWRQVEARQIEKKAADAARRQAEEVEEKQALEKRAWHREQARAAYRAFTSAPAPGGRP